MSVALLCLKGHMQVRKFKGDCAEGKNQDFCLWQLRLTVNEIILLLFYFLWVPIPSSTMYGEVEMQTDLPLSERTSNLLQGVRIELFTTRLRCKGFSNISNPKIIVICNLIVKKIWPHNITLQENIVIGYPPPHRAGTLLVIYKPWRLKQNFLIKVHHQTSRSLTIKLYIYCFHSFTSHLHLHHKKKRQ